MTIASKLSDLISVRDGLITKINMVLGLSIKADSTLTECLDAMKLTIIKSYDLTSLKSLPEKYSLSRLSTATYWNHQGILVTAANDTARFDYKYSDNIWIQRGLLLEESRTNKAQMSNYSGESNKMVVTTGQTDITNQSNALLVSSIAGRNDSYIDFIGASQANLNDIHTYSIFTKLDSISNNIILRSISTSAGSDIETVYKVVDSKLSLLKNNLPISIVDYNNWNRLSFRVNANGGVYTRTQPSTGLSNTDTNTAEAKVIISHVQLENGSYQTSPIPTTYSAVTRAADVLTVTAENTHTIKVTYERQDTRTSEFEFIDLFEGENNITAGVIGIGAWIQSIEHYNRLLTFPEKTVKKAAAQ